jgi:phosphatidylglycerophosphatase A
MTLGEKPARQPGPMTRLLGTFFGFGSLPLAPGTWGSAAALGIYLLLRYGDVQICQIFCPLLAVVFSGLTLLVGRDAEVLEKGKDPGWFVLDEMAGVFLALTATASYNLMLVGFGFVLFRLLDALKPGVVGWAERRFKGSLGILMDDLIAGLLAGLALQGLNLILHFSGVLN